MAKGNVLGLCLALVILGACSNDEDQYAERVPVFRKQYVPSSPRSRQAIGKVGPRLIGEFNEKGLEYGSPIFVRIFKEEMELEMWMAKDGIFKLFRTYKVVRLSGKLGPKLREGDWQGPEGFYYVTPSRMNPNSRYHLSFNLGYPNVYDKAHGRTGSALMVHGGSASIGCYAMTDAGVEEIYALADGALRNGQRFFRVHCFPFRMTDHKMNSYRKSEWYGFWLNLRRGYDFFERTARPPNVIVRNEKYAFEEE